MRPELETYQLIDNYLNGSLTGEALQAFEQRLQSDASFAEEVSFQRLTNEIVVGASFDSLRAQMTRDIASRDTSSRINRKWGLAGILSGIVAIGIIGIYTFSKEEKPVAASTDRAAQQTAPERNVSPVESSVSSNKTLHGKPAKPAQTILHTPVSATQETEKHPVQTPGQQHVSDQSAAEKTGIKSIETTTPTPLSTSDDTTNPCDKAAIKATIVSNPSCADASNGSILIPMNQISGGTKPYTVRFNMSGEAGTKEQYNYLAPGTYTIYITDAKGCAKSFQTEVTEKSCRKASFVFAPDKGQVCTITGKDNQPYILTILNMAGKQVYKTTTIEGSFEWQGLSQQGEYLDAGLYIYILEYVSGEKENGQITIVR